MNKKSKIIAFFVSSGLSTISALTIFIMNKTIKMTATSKHLLDVKKALCFKWRLGNVCYTKQGNGKPILFLHDLNYFSNSYEWETLVPELSKTHTVYTIDLLGFGRSEKPNLTYTNYLYVQLLCDFIRSEIGHRTDIVSSGSSSSLAIMACSTNADLFDQLVLINPETILSSSCVPGKNAKLFKFIMDLPLVGTLIYHISCRKKVIRGYFLKEFYYNPYSVNPDLINIWYESAHSGDSPKSSYASVRCSYTKCNVSNALKKIDNSIYLIGGGSVEGIKENLEEYKKYNCAIEYTIISRVKRLPHLEKASRVFDIMETYLN